jgi:hypothetical protein
MKKEEERAREQRKIFSGGFRLVSIRFAAEECHMGKSVSKKHVILPGWSEIASYLIIPDPAV